MSVVGGAMLCATSAKANSFTATLGEPLRESEHAVSVEFRDGVVRYSVQRAIHNDGTRHDEAQLGISLPVGAAATGLRIKAGDHWFAGELMRAERAAELYRELTGFGPHQVKDPALLSWQWSSALQLRVFPVPPGASATVGYALVSPTQYRKGRYFATYPRVIERDGLAAPMLQMLDASAPQLDGKPVTNGRPLSLLAATDKPAWFGDREPDPSASYASSLISITDDLAVTTIKVTVDARHTYRSDLVVELIDPEGTWHPLFDREGDGANDLREQFDVPVTTAAKGDWRLVVSDHAGLDVGWLQAWSMELTGSLPSGGSRELKRAATDTPVFVPDAPRGGDDGHAIISSAAPPIDTIAARLGRVPVSKSKGVFRLEVDVAPQLRPLPKDLSVVFVVDASHSVPDGGVKQQLDIARAYLSHVPDASFEIVVFRRFATRLVDGFASAAQFDAKRLEGRTNGAFARGNGSALDAGAQLAAAALAKRAGTRRIVMLTDALLKPSWKNRDALQALRIAPQPTTAHIVLPNRGGGTPTDRRDDDHALAPIANAGGGVLLHYDHLGGPSKELDILALGLVRPVRIDHLALEGITLSEHNQLPDHIGEGDAIREMTLVPRAPTTVVLNGKLWARPFRRVVKTTLPFSRATAAFVFSHDLHHDLTDEEQFRVAMVGRAVSPMTSYLAIEPGVRPSTVGLGLRSEGFGGGGSGSVMGMGMGRLHGTAKPDLKSALRDALEACVRDHQPARGWAVGLALHTTFDEIVDVEASPPRGPMSQCLSKAAWKLRLPPLPQQRRGRFDLSFP